MKKTFNKEYFLSHRGCYSREKMEGLVTTNLHSSIEEFLNWPISIKDKFFFVRNYCELTTRQKQLLALECAKVSLKIYELKYPSDNRIAKGIVAIEEYLNNSITLEAFNLARTEIRQAANAADAATYAANAANANAADAAYAAYAATYAANAANAADAATYAADAATYAANAAYANAADAATYAANTADANAANAAANANAKVHENNLLNSLRLFCKNN